MTELVLVCAGIITAGALALWAIRENRCPSCDHCKRIERDARERKDRLQHESYHRYYGEKAEDCRDDTCRGRR